MCANNTKYKFRGSAKPSQKIVKTYLITAFGHVLVLEKQLVIDDRLLHVCLRYVGSRSAAA